MRHLQKKVFLIVSDNTIQADGLSDFLKNLCKNDITYRERWQK